MLKLNLKQVRAIFSEQKITARMDNLTTKALKRAGAFVQRTARRSMRKGGKVSQPGQPPKSREGQLKRFLFFVVDRQAESVVIGPVKLSGAEDAPAVLEHGGITDRTLTSRGQGRRTVAADYEPRPFMAPALQKETANLPELWANAFK